MISIQVLRAIAALLVVMVHTTLKAQSMGFSSKVFEIGHSGVDLFFIISGFIMMMIGARENKFSIFMSKRIVRVIPLYYIITSFALVIYIINPSLIRGNQDGITVLNSYLLIPTEGKSFLLSVGWTLSYEMFFYLTFSLTLFIKSSMKGIAASLLLLAFVVLGKASDNVSINTFMSPILLEFAMGIACFYIYAFCSSRINENTRVMLSLLMIISAAAYVFSSEDPLFTIFNNRVIDLAVPMMLVFLAFCFVENKFKTYKSNIISRLMAYIGDASYSLYLVHLFALGAIAKAFSTLGITNSFAFISACLVISVVAGIACYEVIEKPVSSILKKVIFKRDQSIKSTIKAK
ncbi:acyltransferase [Serratia fonticola]|uniref:acyltransferase family protein n=1 Tax=Serratia fonticola TaxID=47917 RepID=UPI003AAD007C